MSSETVKLFNSLKSSSDTFIELEFRREINGDLFKKYSAALTKMTSHSTEYSINFINNSILNRATDKNEQYIRKIIFDSDNKSETFYKKSRISPPRTMNDFKVVISVETAIAKFATSITSLVRFKVRHSVDHVYNGKKWKVDLTATQTYTFDEIKNRIADVRVAFFAEPFKAHAFELEIEYADSVALTEEDLAIANNVIYFIDPSNKLIGEISTLIGGILRDLKIATKFAQPNVKSVANQVISLTKNVYYRDLYPPIGFYTTEKLDGVRALVKAKNQDCYIITNDLHNAKNADIKTDDITIVDAEYYNETVYIFDVLMVRGVNLTAQPFAIRYKHLADAAKIISAYTSCEVKKFEIITQTNMEKVFSGIYNAEYEYEIDGLIMTSPNDNYALTKSYKWKPSENNTIDFLVKKAPTSFGMGENVYLLFVGISREMFIKFGITQLSVYGELFENTNARYFPVHFCPSMDPCAFIFRAEKPFEGENKIVEFVLQNGKWEPIRIRLDREPGDTYFGNDFKVAETIYCNYLDKFALKDLWMAPTIYFRESATNAYRASNHLRRRVIDNIIKTYFANRQVIIDEACGRGADIQRYLVNGVHNILFIDIDATAIAELISRKYNVVKNDRAKAASIYAMVADLNEPNKKTLATIKKFCLPEADGIMCNFALHYMVANLSAIKNILTLNYELLRSGGYFIFTTFDGAKVFKLLKNKKMLESWTLSENSRVKYSITKKFMGDKMADFGQTISVLLPFTDESYDEYLVNFDVIKKVAEEIGFKMLFNKSLKEYEETIKVEDITQADLEYNALYSVVVLQKK